MNPWHAWRLRATLRRLTEHARQEGGEPPPDLLARLRAEIPPDLARPRLPAAAPRRQPEPRRARNAWRPRWALAAASLALVATAGLVALRVERDEAFPPRTSAAAMAGAARANLAAPREAGQTAASPPRVAAARGDAGPPRAATSPAGTSPTLPSPASTSAGFPSPAPAAPAAASPGSASPSAASPPASPSAAVASSAAASTARAPAPGTPEAARPAVGSLAAPSGAPAARTVGAMAKAAPVGEAARDSLRAAGTPPVAPLPASPRSAALGVQPAAPAPPPPMLLTAPMAPSPPMAAMPPSSPQARLARQEAPRPLRSTFGAATGTAAYDLLRDDLLGAGRLPAPGTLRLDQLANAFAPRAAAASRSFAVAAPARARAASREESAPGGAGLEVEGARLPAPGSVYLLRLTAHRLAAPIPADAVEVEFDSAVVLSARRVGATSTAASATALYEVELRSNPPPTSTPTSTPASTIVASAASSPSQGPSSPSAAAAASAEPAAADDLVLATVQAAGLPRRLVRLGDLRSEWEQASASLRLQGLAVRLGEVASTRPMPAPTRWLQLRAEAAALTAELPADPRAAELRRLVERAIELAGLPPARPSP